MSPSTQEQRQARDTVIVCGGIDGTARLGQLLLDAGNPASPGRTRRHCPDENGLEGEAGFRAVAPTSAELVLALPRSDSWHGHHGLT